jgi:hypothetical protein
MVAYRKGGQPKRRMIRALSQALNFIPYFRFCGLRSTARPVAAPGQAETTKHVRGHGSFPRKRSLRPLPCLGQVL